jgi:predicted RNA-binding protein with PUA-like domain
MKYWLMKTEPNTYSWDDLLKEKVTSWEGVRNYQARNFMRDDMKIGDQVFIYHSVVKPMAIMGIAEVVREAYADHFAFEQGHKYFDPKSKPENPTWVMVDVQAKHSFKNPIKLEQLKAVPGLEEMMLLQKGSRLSIQPVSKEEWDIICSLDK